MQLIDQHTKKIMEGCKERARDAGLSFDAETLEYIVTNRDLLELSAKSMIPSLYDYWVHDVEVLREKGRYELYPSNPYETVINTRPAISFYNDNNPDWLNVMIFYHVLAHIDFFQNNLFYENTWGCDFNGEALADKRMIARFRSTYGRWVDYILEFARGIDNLVGYYDALYRNDAPEKSRREKQVDYYFDHFLQSEKRLTEVEYLKEVEQYNASLRENGSEVGTRLFFNRVSKIYPEFDEKFKTWSERGVSGRKQDILEFLMDNSAYLNRHENKWMKAVIEVVRKTAVFFQPQIRTKIMNEGWATYWHERLFLEDDRINGHEVDFSKVNSMVASLSRVGLNPYALGMRLFQDIEQAAENGRYSYEFEKLLNREDRQAFGKNNGSGRDYLFAVRKHLCDGLFVRQFVNQDFIDRHRLFVSGRRLNRARRTWEYYVKSRKAQDYRRMLLDNLYHPPAIGFSVDDDGQLNLIHQFEGRPLVADFISNTMLGVEFLWGRPVTLETYQVKHIQQPADDQEDPEVIWEKVKYIMDSKTLHKMVA
ncbi:MAG: SpoVR family protein [Thermodesulfobacteriota bacterium]